MIYFIKFVCRLEDCRAELHALLQEERLAGATLLVALGRGKLADSAPSLQICQTFDIGDTTPPFSTTDFMSETCAFFATKIFRYPGLNFVLLLYTFSVIFEASP